MAKARELVRRRKSVQNTRKITRTMEMVSTAKFKQAMNRAVATRPYAGKLAEMLQTLAPACEGSGHPLLVKRPEPKRASVVIVTSNRGLCGGYNSNVLRAATQYMTGWKERGVAIDLHVSGKRGLSFCRYKGWEVAGRHTAFADKPTYADVAAIADQLIASYEAGETDSVAIAYMAFESASRQKATVHQLLPLEGFKLGGEKPKGDVLFDPDPESILGELLPLYVRTSFFSAFLDAVVSEHIARMVAMKAATDAAVDMIRSLSRAYNRARQGQITNEIAEIVGGAAALQ